MFKQFCMIVTLSLAIVFLNTPTYAYHFPDVKEDDELVIAVDYLSSKGIINGYPDGTYQPTTPISRGQAAKIIAGALELNIESPARVDFTDVPQSNMYYPYIAALAEIGIFDSTVTHFRPNDTMTRAEMAKVLALSFDFYNEKPLPFLDTPNHWAELFISQLYATGVTKGVSPSLFGVDQPVDRGQLARFIIRSLDYIVLAREAVTAQSLGYDNINGSIYYSIGNPDAVNVITYDDYVLFDAVEVGTAYGWVENAAYDFDYLATEAIFYQFDVVDEDGQLVLYKTELDEKPAVPAFISLYGNIDDYELLYLDGTAVDEQLIDAIYYDHYLDLYVYDLFGDFILRYSNEDGHKFQLLVSIEDGLIFPQVYESDYVTSSIHILNTTIWQAFGVNIGTFKHVTALSADGEIVSEDALEISFSDDTVSLVPKQSSSFELYIEGTVEDVRIYIMIEQYGEGFTIDWATSSFES